VHITSKHVGRGAHCKPDGAATNKIRHGRERIAKPVVIVGAAHRQWRLCVKPAHALADPQISPEATACIQVQDIHAAIGPWILLCGADGEVWVAVLIEVAEPGHRVTKVGVVAE